MNILFDRVRYHQVCESALLKVGWGVFAVRDQIESNQFLFYVFTGNLYDTVTVRVSESISEEIREYMEWLDRSMKEH
ncbi:hypothetical protein [Thermoactinomyces sp. DSM 45891]|uniref:hypothetical protein n=1 Tax=Thermoactinomyces sp. DSM 45891 TaxID=1761907 RepID=UPI00093105A9|nr:hypothetical protein [Thermoactinomyces sp. DSM 45891]